MKFHSIFMVEVSHNLNFFDQALFAFFLTVGGFLSKSFHCIICFIFCFFDQKDCGKVSFPNFLVRLELLMKSSLIEFAFQNLSPTIDLTLWFQCISYCIGLSLKLDLRGRMSKAKLHIEIKLDRLDDSFTIFFQTFFGQCNLDFPGILSDGRRC